MIAPTHLTQHPLSAAFPRPSADEFQALKDSILDIGVQIPITIHDGQVIDGWSRYSAAAELNMECPAVELDGTDPQNFAKSQTARRNLTTSQIAMVIVEIYKWRPVGTNQHKLASALRAEPSPKEIADTNGIGLRTIERARTVQTHAVPEVQAAVKNGEVGLPKAAAIAKLPQAEQAAALTKPLPKDYPVKPVEVEVNAYPPEDFGRDEDELAAQEAAEQADRQTLQLLLESDDKLAAAVAEIKRLNAEFFTLKKSRDGVMNESNVLIRLGRVRKVNGAIS